MKKKLIALTLAAVLAFAMGISAAAEDGQQVTGEGGGEGQVPVELTQSATTFDVTVPTVLPIYVDGNGNVTTAEDVYIVNNGYGMVEVSGLEISGSNGWATVDFGTDMTKVPVNTKQLGMEINGNETTGADVIEFDASKFAIMDGIGTSTEDGNKAEITYDAVVPAASDAIVNAAVANVVFTIEWHMAEAPEPIEG